MTSLPGRRRSGFRINIVDSILSNRAGFFLCKCLRPFIFSLTLFDKCDCFTCYFCICSITYNTYIAMKATLNLTRTFSQLKFDQVSAIARATAKYYWQIRNCRSVTKRYSVPLKTLRASPERNCASLWPFTNLDICLHYITLHYITTWMNWLMEPLIAHYLKNQNFIKQIITTNLNKRLYCGKRTPDHSTVNKQGNGRHSKRDSSRCRAATLCFMIFEKPLQDSWKIHEIKK